MRLRRSSLVVAAVCLISLLVVSPALAAGNVGMRSSSSGTLTPVLTGGASWDVQGAGTAGVILDGSVYRMWYSGSDVDGLESIGYATSSDGSSWTEFGSNPVLVHGNPGAFDSFGVAGPSVIKDGATYKMWYTGRDSGNVLRIGYATASAPEGPWTKNGTAVLSPQAGAWNKDGVGGPSVIMESASSYKMWFTGRSDDGTTLGEVAIGYATSSDGLDWNVRSAPVLTKGGAGDWDSRSVGAASVVKSAISGGSHYSMYYTGYSGYAVPNGGLFSSIGYASSSDGINWVKPAGDSIVAGGTAGTFAEKGIGAPSVVRTANGGTKVWFTGITNNLTPAIGYAASAHTQSTTTIAATWNMFSLPVDPAQLGNDFGAVLGGSLPAPLFVFWYDPGTGGYKTYPFDTVSAQPGRGYWLRGTAPTSVTVEGLDWSRSAYPDGKSYYEISVEPGWNMVGAPVSQAVNWGDGRFISDAAPGVLQTIADAHAAGRLSQYLFNYNTVDNRYDMKGAADGTIAPWVGYWVRVFSAGTLLIPAPAL